MSKQRAAVTVEILGATLIAHVRTAKGEIVYSTKPAPSEKTFREVMWPAADWARSNGYEVK